LNPTVEAGANLDNRRTRPADILRPAWTLGAPAALDLTVVHPLTQINLTGASTDVCPSALAAAVEHKHKMNNAKCQDLGWACVPMAITTFGGWDQEANDTISRICERLALASGACARQVHSGVRMRLSVVLMRENGRALLSSRGQRLCAYELVAGGDPSVPKAL
ncbi:MAG: hypothetical protein AAFO86_14720, partial [Pseudomonadota bacterium]